MPKKNTVSEVHVVCVCVCMSFMMLFELDMYKQSTYAHILFVLMHVRPSYTEIEIVVRSYTQRIYHLEYNHWYRASRV